MTRLTIGFNEPPGSGHRYLNQLVLRPLEFIENPYENCDDLAVRITPARVWSPTTVYLRPGERFTFSEDAVVLSIRPPTAEDYGLEDEQGHP